MFNKQFHHYWQGFKKFAMVQLVCPRLLSLAPWDLPNSLNLLAVSCGERQGGVGRDSRPLPRYRTAGWHPWGRWGMTESRSSAICIISFAVLENHLVLCSMEWGLLLLLTVNICVYTVRALLVPAGTILFEGF